jgi:hypothetical protein
VKGSIVVARLKVSHKAEVIEAYDIDPTLAQRTRQCEFIRDYQIMTRRKSSNGGIRQAELDEIHASAKFLGGNDFFVELFDDSGKVSPKRIVHLFWQLASQIGYLRQNVRSRDDLLEISKKGSQNSEFLAAKAFLAAKILGGAAIRQLPFVEEANQINYQQIGIDQDAFAAIPLHEPQQIHDGWLIHRADFHGDNFAGVAVNFEYLVSPVNVGFKQRCI